MNTRKASGVVMGLALASTLLLGGCGEPVDQKTGGDAVEPAGPAAKKESPTLFKIGDEIFAIPSPVQTAFLIKETGANFDEAILNSADKHTNYATKIQKALNLGIYGADMGYATIYDQKDIAMSYMLSTRKLADDLGVTGAFSKSLVDRFEANMGNQDSLLVLVTEAYRKTDAYLKSEQREDIGGMILAGGWIEALYFSINIAKDSQDQKVLARIGEQKASLENLIKLIQRHANDPESQQLMTDLYDLYILFDEVETTYEFVDPVTHTEKQMTEIRSKSSVNISPESLQAITDKAISIRNQIVG